MIKCYLNKSGYYIVGDKLEIANAPKLRETCDDLECLYLSLISLLSNLKGINGTVYIYNDSRLINDINGFKALGSIYNSFVRLIRQKLLPEISGVVFFRKKSSEEIEKMISDAFVRLNINSGYQPNRPSKETKIEQFKRRWLNGKY